MLLRTEFVVAITLFAVLVPSAMAYGDLAGVTPVAGLYVALGAMVALTGVVSKESAEKAVLARVPEAFLELNKKAFAMGFEKAQAAAKG